MTKFDVDRWIKEKCRLKKELQGIDDKVEKLQRRKKNLRNLLTVCLDEIEKLATGKVKL